MWPVRTRGWFACNESRLSSPQQAAGYLVEVLHEEGNQSTRHVLAILVSRHLGGLSESSKRAREQRFIICGQEFVTHSKRQKTIHGLVFISRGVDICLGKYRGIECLP